MRISARSSDVCSSDLKAPHPGRKVNDQPEHQGSRYRCQQYRPHANLAKEEHANQGKSQEGGINADHAGMKEGKAVRISSMNGIVNDNVANPKGNQWHQKSHPAACVPTRPEQCHGAHRRIIQWMRPEETAVGNVSAST